MLVKTGNLYKQGGGGPSLFQRKNWKPRCFKLTAKALEYYDYKSGDLKGTIDLTSCRGPDAIDVMPSDCVPTSIFTTVPKWRLAITTPARRWFLAADSEPLLLEWADALVTVLQNLQPTQSSPGLPSSPAASRGVAVTQRCA